MRDVTVERRLAQSASRTIRASISFPIEIYQELERIAAAKKVSLAWVVREAAEKYVADQWPLFASGSAGGRT
jgi:predicted DNA-binding protein